MGMSGNYLLDTSVLIELFAKDTVVLTRLEKAESTFIPSIALGELHYGARKSSRTEKNLEKLEALASEAVILPCDAETSYWYGIVKDGLRRVGQPIPENDIWIAAIALQYGLTLATRDNHFQIVENLKFEMW
jgi:tRNA(fMet)-specific endonuclease VapC